METLEKQMDEYRVRTFGDLLRALKAHPEWLEELRKLILTTELLELPRKVDELIRLVKQHGELLKEHDKRLTRIEQDIQVLKQDVTVLKRDVAGLKEDVAVLKRDVAGLKEDVAVLKRDVAGLKEDVAVLKRDVAGLKDDVETLKDQVGGLRGKDYERTVRERYPAIVWRVVRKSRILSTQKLADRLDEAVETGTINEQDYHDAMELDAVIEGRDWHSGEPVVLAVEASVTAFEKDVHRAAERAQILQRAFGIRAIPVVVCDRVSTGVEQTAQEYGVQLLSYQYQT